MPSLQRDFLLQLATEEAYAPVWGSGILFELDYVLAGLHAKRGISDSASRRQHLFDKLKRAFPGAEVQAPKDRDYSYGLNDPDDGHVAHAAIIGKADAIVTDDRRAAGDVESPGQPTTDSGTDPGAAGDTAQHDRGRRNLLPLLAADTR